MTSSSAGFDAGATPQHVSGATVVTPAPVATTTGNPSPMSPYAQAQTTAEPTQTPFAPAPVQLVDAGLPGTQSDPVTHDRIDAVMGGRSKD